MSENDVTVQMHFPQGHLGASTSDDAIDLAMRVIAVAFGAPDEWAEKYGTRYENDVFAMRPDYQDVECVCGYEERREAWHAANPHRDGCYQLALYADESLDYKQRDVLARELCAQYGIPWNDGKASMVHCTCDWPSRWSTFAASDDHGPSCPIGKPNFLYKPTGFALTWYKYIGRSMETEGTIPSDMLIRVFASHPSGRTMEQAFAELERRTEETQRQWSQMLASLNTRT